MSTGSAAPVARGAAVSRNRCAQRAWLHDVEREIGRTLTVQDDHEWHCEVARHSTKRAPVLGGGPVKQVKAPKEPRERKVWTEEEKLAARMAAKAA
jgi:ATP-dependent RNA helicase RhlE